MLQDFKCVFVHFVGTRRYGVKLTHSFPMHPFSPPLKTSENLKVFRCFQGERKGALERNGLIRNLHLVRTANFRKTNIFYPLIRTRTCVFGKFCVRIKWMIPKQDYKHVP